MLKLVFNTEIIVIEIINSETFNKTYCLCTGRFITMDVPEIIKYEEMSQD